MTTMFEFSEGWFSDFQHNLFRGILGIVYIILMISAIYKDREQRTERFIQHDLMYRWLIVFIVIQIFIVLIHLLIISPFSWITEINNGFIAIAMFAFCSTIISIFLLTRPELMYGLPESKPLSADIEKSIPIPVQPSPTVDQSNYAHYVIEIDNFMKVSEAYLQQDYSLDKLSADLDIPNHHLSYVFNRVMNVPFRDYLNALRLNYMMQLVNSGEKKNFTLEALALKSGFGSRSTFHRAVYKLKGMSPAEYYKPADSSGRN